MIQLRATGSTIALSPPLIADKAFLEQMVDTLGAALTESAEALAKET